MIGAARGSQSSQVRNALTVDEVRLGTTNSNGVCRVTAPQAASRVRWLACRLKELQVMPQNVPEGQMRLGTVIQNGSFGYRGQLERREFRDLRRRDVRPVHGSLYVDYTLHGEMLDLHERPPVLPI